MTENPSYYAIIPAEVRYDDRLSSSEKLLFGEITCLTQKTGECWASNKYFSKLYKVEERTIKNWFKKLEDLGYITREYTYKENSKEVEKRSVKIVTTRCKNIHQPGENNFTTPGEKNFPDNNININNININNDVSHSNTPAGSFNKEDNINTYKGEDCIQACDSIPKVTKHKYGEYKHVQLTDTQLKELQNEFPNNWQEWIDRVDTYCESSGKHYNNYLATIKNWAKKDFNNNFNRTSYNKNGTKNANGQFNLYGENRDSRGNIIDPSKEPEIVKGDIPF